MSDIDVSLPATDFVEGSNVPPFNAAVGNKWLTALKQLASRTVRTAAGKTLDSDALGGETKTTVPGSPWGMPTVYLPDTLRAAVEAASGGRNTVLYDDQGNPSYMVVVPKFNVEDVDSGSQMGTGVHPAFVVGGVEKPYILIGQVPASQANGNRACSIPGRDPWCSLDFDAARAACVNKGAGWHLMTAWEWAAVALWAMKNGSEPRGNTYYGRAHDAVWETAPRQDGLAPGYVGGTARNRGGLGPAKWRHDATPVGIADLVGNVWEWSDGLNLRTGQIYCPDDNNYGLAEASWTATGATTANLNAASGSNWKDIPLSAGFDALSPTIRQRLARLMVAPKTSSGGSAIYATKGGYWFDATSERVPLRGGDWSTGSVAGLGALYLSLLRSYVGIYVGVRPAFIP
jgi:hypothetical protein